MQRFYFSLFSLFLLSLSANAQIRLIGHGYVGQNLSTVESEPINSRNQSDLSLGNFYGLGASLLAKNWVLHYEYGKISNSFTHEKGTFHLKYQLKFNCTKLFFGKQFQFDNLSITPLIGGAYYLKKDEYLFSEQGVPTIVHFPEDFYLMCFQLTTRFPLSDMFFIYSDMGFDRSLGEIKYKVGTMKIGLSIRLFDSSSANP